MHSIQRVKQLLPFRQRARKAGVLHLTSAPMSSTDTTTLPTELIELIVDQLGASHDGFETLKTCALVSRAFLFPAQKYLFYSINLDRPHTSRKKTVQRFHKLLLARPHLGVHVRALYLGDDLTDLYGYEDDDIGSYTVSSSELWVPLKKGAKPKSLQLIPQILDRVPRLLALSVTFNPNMLRWGDIPQPTLEALSAAFGRESLREVALSFVPACPPQLLWMLARLKVVSLSGVELDAGAIEVPVPETEVNIETLVLRTTPPPTILAFAQILDASEPGSSPLRSLAVTPTFEPGFCEAVAQLISSGGHELVNFEWLPTIHFYSSSNPIVLSPETTPHLTSLRFSISFRKSQTHTGGPFVEVLRLLEGLRPTSSAATPEYTSLRTVTIDCHCLRPSTTQTHGVQITNDEEIALRKLKTEWGPLDRALVALVGYPSLEDPDSAADSAMSTGLREVRVRLSTSTSAPQDRDSFMRAFPHLMPALQSRGVLLSVTTVDNISVF